MRKFSCHFLPLRPSFSLTEQAISTGLIWFRYASAAVAIATSQHRTVANSFGSEILMTKFPPGHMHMQGYVGPGPGVVVRVVVHKIPTTIFGLIFGKFHEKKSFKRMGTDFGFSPVGVQLKTHLYKFCGIPTAGRFDRVKNWPIPGNSHHTCHVACNRKIIMSTNLDILLYFGTTWLGSIRQRMMWDGNGNSNGTMRACFWLQFKCLNVFWLHFVALWFIPKASLREYTEHIYFYLRSRFPSDKTLLT